MNFETKKSLGQNFIRDKNLLNALVVDANVLNTDCVLEIGAGLGSLTEVLAEKAKRVLSIETDLRLENILREKFENKKNVEFIFKDILKIDLKEIDKIMQEPYIVVANIPYYITSPILFKFFEEKNFATKLAVMVQKEVAERIVSLPGNKEYGVLSVISQFVGDVKILRKVGRENFFPKPKVDSAFLAIDIKNKKADKEFFQFVKECFSMRRKTLLNNIKCEKNKETILNWLNLKNKDNMIRAEELSAGEFYDLFCFLSKSNKIVNL